MTTSRVRVIFYVVAALISLAGLAEATYLTVLSLTGETAVCGGSASCFQVLGSVYARIAGIPIAAFGILAYFSAFGFAIFAAFGYARVRKFFGLTVCAMFAVTLWLLFVQAFILHAFCRYCLFSAALVFVLAAKCSAYPFVALTGSSKITSKSEEVCAPRACLYKYSGGGRVSMHIKLFIFLLPFLLLALTGCKKTATTQLSAGSPAAASPANQQSGEAYFDVCALITKEQIEAVMGSPIKDTKSSGRSDGSFRVSQCFYTAAEFSKSVSLAVTQSDPDSPAKRGPKDFWKETFGRYEGEVKESESDKEKKESLREERRGKEEKEESTPPKKIAGIGDEAFWTSNRFGGALYVLKKDAFIRISVGGPDKEETKIDKSKALAQKALEHL